MCRSRWQQKAAIIGLLFAAAGLWSAPASAVSVIPQPSELPAAPLLVTSYQISGGRPAYIQLYNTSGLLVNLDGWTLTVTMRYLDDATSSATSEVSIPIKLGGYLQPKYYAVVANGANMSGADSVFTLPSDFSSLGVISLGLTHPNYEAADKATEFVEGARYDLSKTSAGNYTATSAFRPAAPEAPLYSGGLYTVPSAPPLRVTAIAANAKQCSVFDFGPSCREYVTIQNTASEPLVLDGYRLRIGYGNQGSTIDNTVPLTGRLSASGFLSIVARSDGKPLNIAASGGFVWIEDSYGLISYKSTEVAYRDIGGRNRKGQAWALDSPTGQWRWARASLNAPNDFNVPEPATAVSSLTPCAPNQYRSTETNRCRLLTTVGSSFAPCKLGQYRSSETNRCRSLATTSTSLTPCKPGQFRNPETNRCKALASSSASLTPCKSGQERNPDTNRCRNVKATAPPAAKFPVEAVADSTKAFAGWWALGGVTTLAAGYAGWEWRHELAVRIKRVATFFSSKK